MDRVSDTSTASRDSTHVRVPQKRNWRSPLTIVTAVVGVALVVLLGSAFAFQSAYAGQVYPGVKVGDVDVGGMTKEAALVKLKPWLGEHSNYPMRIKAPDFQKTVVASDLGATFDAAAAVEDAYSVGRTGSLLDRTLTQLHARFSGQQVQAPGMRLDRSKLSAVVASWAREIDRPVRDTELKLGGNLAVTVTPSVVGRQLNQSTAAAGLESALKAGTESIALPVSETAPKVTERDVEEARAKLARMVSGPVTAEFGDKTWSVTPKEIAAATTIDQKQGTATPVVTFKDDGLKKLVDKIGAEIDRPKMNARFDWNGGKPKLLRAGQDGRRLDREKALSSLTAAVIGDAKTVRLPVELDKAVGNNVDPSTLGLKELIETASTSFAGSVPEKAHNIRLAASRLNGVLLAPGDIFSFNREMGPTTLKSGFQIGFGISVANGEMQTIPSVAGGICQVATTLFHTVFDSGYQIEERYPHAYWIPSYGLPPKGMVGLDTTVDDPNLDFKFMNNTDHYVLIQSGTEGSTVTFSLYGTKPNWKIEIDKPVITNVVKADPVPVKQLEPTWPAGKELWVERATDGMDVVITRRVIQNGEVRTLNLKSHYEPSGNVLMVGSGPAPKPAATPAPAATPGPAAAPATTATQAPTPAPTAAKPQPTVAQAAPKPAATPTPQHH